MDEHGQGIKKRRRRGVAEVEELFEAFQQSGMSVGNYCRQHAVSRSSLSGIVARRRAVETSATHSALRKTSRSSRPAVPMLPSTTHGPTLSLTAKPTATLRTAPRAAGFVPVEIVSTASLPARSSLRVELPGGVHIAVDVGFEEETLLRLLAVLGRA
jgi:hypothetical protein